MLVIAGILLGIAFFTLFERKILGYVHFRKGPSKIYYFGVFQPISDALNLFSKGFLNGYNFSFYYFIAGPLLGLFLMIILWGIYDNYFNMLGSVFSIIYIFCFMSLGVYFLLFCGWGSSSNYSLLGGYRSISQTISYEVCLIFFGLVFVFLIFFYDVFFLFYFQLGYWFIFWGGIFFCGWFFVCLAESNRTPFDFSEGESELVSGFNVEYGGGVFSLIFICEYGIIIFLGFMSTLFFFGSMSFLFNLMAFCFFFVWVRCCFPRYRYDLLMYCAWNVLLPLVIFFLFFVCVCLFYLSSFCSNLGLESFLLNVN